VTTCTDCGALGFIIRSFQLRSPRVKDCPVLTLSDRIHLIVRQDNLDVQNNVAKPGPATQGTAVRVAMREIGGNAWLILRLGFNREFISPFAWIYPPNRITRRARSVLGLENQSRARHRNLLSTSSTICLSSIPIQALMSKLRTSVPSITSTLHRSAKVRGITLATALMVFWLIMRACG
jgi:hypothetical protein